MTTTGTRKPLECLRGITAPFFTPCDAEGKLDLDGAAALTDWLAGRRCVRSLFVRSGMGKMFTFTVDETRQLARAVFDANAARMGLLVGAAGEWLEKDRGAYPDPERYTAQAVELTRFAAELGADAAVHVLPSALGPGTDGSAEEAIYRYLRIVHDAADIPIVLYQPGGLPAEYCLTPGLLQRLLELPRLAGAKVSTTDDAVFAPLVEAARGSGFSLVCGHEGYYLTGLRQGAVGVIGQGCVGYPEILDGVQRAYLSGNLNGAERAQADVWRALEATRGLDSTVAFKQVFARKGVRIQPYDRSGTAPYAPEIVEQLERALDALIAPYAVASGN